MMNSKLLTTPIAELHIPFLEVLLEEVFLMPLPFFPGRIWERETLGKLAKEAEIAEKKALLLVESYLTGAQKTLVPWDRSILAEFQLVETATVHEPKLPESLRLQLEISSFDFKEPKKWLESRQAAQEKFLFISANGKRSFSIALYLFAQGWKHAFCLERGWQSVDHFTAN